MQTIRPNTLFFAGCVLQGVAPLLLTLFSPSSPIIIVLLGCVLGLALGLYWGNRNLATLRTTEGKHRTAFLSLESVQNTLAGVLMPFIIGLGIAYATNNIHLAYIVLVVIGFVLLSIAGALVLRTDETPIPKRAIKTSPIQITSRWNTLRAFEVLNGAITSNEAVISLLMILTFFGLEGAVGTTKSSMAIITAIMMFFFGKRLQRKHYPAVMTIAAIFLIGSASLFGLFPTNASILVFFGSLALIAGLRTVTEMSVVYGTIDDEVQKTAAIVFIFFSIAKHS